MTKHSLKVPGPVVMIKVEVSNHNYALMKKSLGFCVTRAARLVPEYDIAILKCHHHVKLESKIFHASIRQVHCIIEPLGRQLLHDIE